MSGIDKVCNGSSVTKMKPASPDLALVNYCATILMQGGTHEQIKQHLNEHQNGLSEDVCRKIHREAQLLLQECGVHTPVNCYAANEWTPPSTRSEEHTSELQSQSN